ncbi:MAG: TIGR03862 family flavoprotein [Polaromonas sp.]|nr:TIGR03862 family flavoprotein [Polaromonas sp.]
MAVIGGGPAGLMAAEILSGAGPALSVQVFDAMPSVGRKFLLAGKGGLNLTHSEPPATFNARYGDRAASLEPLLAELGGAEMRQWAEGLGVDTFVGSSGRVFPKDMKAAPLLRSWLHRLRASGVQFSMRHRWLGWADNGALRFSTPSGEQMVQVDAVVLALGGGSWSRLGSDGAWVPLLAQRGIDVQPLRPSNCGFDVAARPVGLAETAGPVAKEPSISGWSPYFVSRFAGQPFKSVAINLTDSLGQEFSRRGEFVATATGVEGSLVYAASSFLRDDIERTGSATFTLDLRPDKSAQQVLAEVRHPRGSRSLSSHLKSRLGLEGIKAAILHELLDKDAMANPIKLAAAIKALPITVVRTRPIDEAISSAGGVSFDAVDADLKIKASQPVGGAIFCAGEMLDWEAPTGGYLMTACFASGRKAGQGVLRHFGITS